jgi:hypothetical protein
LCGIALPSFASESRQGNTIDFQCEGSPAILHIENINRAAYTFWKWDKLSVRAIARHKKEHRAQQLICYLWPS